MTDIELNVIEPLKENDLDNAGYCKRLQKSFNEAQQELVRRRAIIDALSREIEILRLYGNKDCTAMADEALAKLRDEAPASHNPDKTDDVQP